jgi:Tfp pilus assembly protein PilF/peroxiredoxin
MISTMRTRTFVCVVTFVVFVQALFLAGPSRAALRRVNVGDPMPPFSLQTLNGMTFTYEHGGNKVLVLVFLPALQSRVKRVLTDIETLVKGFSQHATELDFACVISGTPDKELLESVQGSSEISFPILLDTRYHLWGALGVIAAPTALVVGKDDKIFWIRAGFDYEFVPVARAYLNQALGIAQGQTPQEVEHIKAVTNDTAAARLQRHLEMAKMLEQKGRLEAAAAELRKAAQLDPNAIEPKLDLGELFCRAGRPNDALDAVQKLKPIMQADKAKILLIRGWATRQTGELEQAQKLLLEAIELDPESTRALFELGKVYQAKGLLAKAAESYRKALTIVFAEPEVAKTLD